MIQVKKSRKAKNSLAIIITSAVLAVLTIGLVIFFAIMGSQSANPSNPSKTESLLVYPTIDSTKIRRFTVDSHNGYFGARLSGGTYYYTYKDDKGEEQIYFPPICYNEAGFNYTSLYATTDDGMNAPKISYILYAISTLSYDSVITLSSEVDYETQLKVYGLDEESRETVTFDYLVTEVDEQTGEKKEVTRKRTVHIGNKLVTGTGYYVKLDSADYPTGDEYKTERENADKLVYVSSGAENYSYALEGFTEFVKPNLIMGGNLKLGDTATHPQLTPSYKQWKNTVFDKVTDKVKDKTKVVFTANTYASAGITGEEEQEEIIVDENGYVTVLKDTKVVDLDYISSNDIYKRFIKNIVGKNVGKYTGGREIISTVIFDQNVAVLDKEYTYKILAVESVIPDDESKSEYTSGNVQNNKLIKVTYLCTLDGKKVSFKDNDGNEVDRLHAVIDLTDERIPASVRNYLLGASVGENLAVPQEFTVTYTTENTTPSVFEYRIKHISHVVNKDTELEVDKISEDTMVNFVYQLLHNGEVIEESSATVALYTSSEDEDELIVSIKEALLSQKSKELKDIQNITAYKSNRYYQLFKDFTTYFIDEINYFVESEEIAAFKFVNSSKRDPYFGEAIHANDLPSSHPYSSYAVDWVSCDRVIKILSGTLAGSSSSIFEGLAGNKVVAVGMNPLNMKEYGLYAYSLYFELPRIVDSDKDNSEDYTWEDTVGFTLYISEANSEGKRYVGSDMYDLIVEMDAETLSFVEKDFIEFWARRDIVMIYQEDIDKVNASFNFTGLTGSYEFFLDHPTEWIVTYADGTTGLLFEDPGDDNPNIISKQEYLATHVSSKVYGDLNLNGSLLAKCYDKWRKNEDGSINENYKVPLKSVYDVRYFSENPNGDPSKLVVGYDYLGDSCFKDLLLVLYGTGYSGTVSEADALAAKENEAVMTLSFEVSGTTTSYTYSFHYTNDGRVAVWVNDGHRESCHFYISNYNLKTIANAFSDLVNGYEIFDE